MRFSETIFRCFKEFFLELFSNASSDLVNKILYFSILFNSFELFQGIRKPKLLPCSHSVCLSCLEQLAALPQNDALSLRCPMCREVCVLPAGGVSGLPAAFLINQLLDVMQ
ncbi:hypothetical protein NECAME_01871, partial [Necator americanus]